MSEDTRLLQLRIKLKRKLPAFKRQESRRLKRIKSSWRRSKGIDNKVRRKEKGNITSPNIGYRSPKHVRYLHSSGFEEIIIHNLTELEKVNPRKQVVKIGGSIGRKKRVTLQDRADELNILILNRTRILLPGEEMLLEEGRGFERESEPFEKIEPRKEGEPSEEEEPLEERVQEGEE